MNTLTAEKRDLKTKAKKLRKEGYVIGNLFGRDIENSIPLKVDSREAAKFLKDNKKGAHITLLVDGENVDAIVKEIDYNAMKNETMFINFQALVADEKIHTTDVLYRIVSLNSPYLKSNTKHSQLISLKRLRLI